MLNDIEIALLLRAAGLVCQRFAATGNYDDDSFDFRQTAQNLFLEAAERMKKGLAQHRPRA